jgi:predicted NACHT family NTPase
MEQTAARQIIRQTKGAIAVQDSTAIQIDRDNLGPVTVGQNNSIRYIVTHYHQEQGAYRDTVSLKEQIEDYLKWVEERYGTIELRGIKREDSPIVQLDLETVYVPLEAVTYVPENLGLSPASGHRLSEPRDIRLDQVLHLGTRLIITGGPGSGKTTVLLYIAWVLASALNADDLQLAESRLGLSGNLPLPIFVPISAYAAHLQKLENVPQPVDPSEKTLASFVSRYLIEKQSGFDLPRDFFTRLLRKGEQVILLLDGLNEVPEEGLRGQVLEKIEELVTGREQMRVVVTCRTAAYRRGTNLGKGFEEVNVKPLEEKHITALITQAYSQIYRHDPQQRQDKTDELLRGITSFEREQRRRLGERAKPLVTSPLLVRMLLVVHLSGQRMPEQRAELYMKATDVMLLPEYIPDREVADRLGRLVGGRWEIHRDLLQHLGFHMHSRGEQQGREINEDGLKQVLSAEATYAPLVDDFIALTRLRGTLLAERLGNYEFIHLSFQEFLAARYLAEILRGEGGVEAMAAFLETV